MIACWEEEWENLDQERIQRWVEQIHHHIQEVIRLHGGNFYRTSE